MDPITLEALNLSIAHWERLANSTQKQDEDCGVESCALCQKFNTPIPSDNIAAKCIGCPVFEKTGQRFCRGTPFMEAEAIFEMTEKYDDPMDTDEFREAAELELEFLKSLVPAPPHPLIQNG